MENLLHRAYEYVLEYSFGIEKKRKKWIRKEDYEDEENIEYYSRDLFF
jgi:hypothetical protein